MNGRDQILHRLAGALGRPTGSAPPSEVTQRLRMRPRSTQPRTADDAIAELIRHMEGVQMTVSELQTTADIVKACDGYLQEHDIRGEITVAPGLAQLDWASSDQAAQVRIGPASGVETTSITPCLAAVAETGSVVMVSSAEHPAGLNFLPDNHVVVLYRDQVVRSLEDVWSLLCPHDAGTLAADSTDLPRAVNLITGPSRTADIEQTLEIGAHGPRRMHVLLVAAKE